MFKKIIPLLFAAVSLSAAGNLPSKGGVSVDFSKTNVKKNPSAASANLVAGFPAPKDAKIIPVQWQYKPGTWYSNFWVHIRAQDGDYRLLMKQIGPFVKRFVKVENGLSFYRIESGMEAWKFKTSANTDVSFSNQFQQFVDLPDDAGGKRYQITLRYRSVLKTSSNANHLRGFITFYDGRKRGAKVLPRTNKVLWIKNSASWSNCSMEFEVPQGAKQLNLNLSLYGPGTFDLADVRIAEVIRKAVLKAQLYPQEELDGIYTVGEKSACPVTFSFSNSGKKKVIL